VAPARPAGAPRFLAHLSFPLALLCKSPSLAAGGHKLASGGGCYVAAAVDAGSDVGVSLFWGIHFGSVVDGGDDDGDDDGDRHSKWANKAIREHDGQKRRG